MILKQFERARVGDFVEIISNSNAHEFEIGQVVQVVEWEDFDPEDADVGVECAPIGGGEHWFVRHTDYRVTAHPSEYERLRQQNEIMLEALELIAKGERTWAIIKREGMQQIAREAIKKANELKDLHGKDCPSV